MKTGQEMFSLATIAKLLEKRQSRLRRSMPPQGYRVWKPMGKIREHIMTKRRASSCSMPEFHAKRLQRDHPDPNAIPLNASQALWIDALCVPTDEPARSSCLREMGWIFSAAFHVIVVLERRCSGLLRCIGRSEKVEDFALLALEEEKWVRRAWTYQEAVNSRALYFVAEGEENLIISGQDFLRSITDAIEDYKLRHALSNLNWLSIHPGLSDLELLLADYRIADFADRSAYQVMSIIGQRFSERTDDYFYSMIGSITTTSSQTEESECPHPAEYFMRVCEQKRDFSFIADGSKFTQELSAFLKGASGYKAGYHQQYSQLLRSEEQNITTAL